MKVLSMWNCSVGCIKCIGFIKLENLPNAFGNEKNEISCLSVAPCFNSFGKQNSDFFSIFVVLLLYPRPLPINSKTAGLH